MHELYKAKQGKEPDEILRDLLLGIKNTYRFDEIKAMHFTNDKGHPYVRISCGPDQLANRFEYNYLLDIGDFDKSFFRLMSFERKIVFYSADDSTPDFGYKPLNVNAAREIYCPLFDEKNDKVIGAIYFCSFSETKLSRGRFLGDYRLNLINCLFSKLYGDMKARSLVLLFLKLFDNFLAKNNPNMQRHHHNVAYWAMTIAEEFGLSDRDKRNLYYAGFLHDIGEIYISGEILGKEGKLTEKEYRIVRNHVVYSNNLAKQILNDDSDRDAILKIILQHHERPDGKGYPKGLRNREIGLQSKILSVADALDSMLTKRSYREPRPLDEALNELKEGKGTQFDPKVVDAIIRLLYRNPVPRLNLRSIPLSIADLCIAENDGSRLIPGVLLPTDTNYEFHPFYASDLDMAGFEGISELKLFYLMGQTIHEFDARFLEVRDGIVLLSEIESAHSLLSDSLYWQVEGLLYISNGSFIQIKVSRINSEAISFLASEDAAAAVRQDGRYEIVLFFDNDEPETVLGRVVQRFRISGEYLFVLVYEKMTKTARERITRRIDGKYAELIMKFTSDSNWPADMFTFYDRN